MLFTTSVRPILRASHLAAPALVLAVAASSAPHAAAQATEHHVYVSVLDQQGNPVTEVTPAELTVRKIPLFPPFAKGE